jgi:NitT/TauT family transport system substrate-binding protein
MRTARSFSYAIFVAIVFAFLAFAIVGCKRSSSSSGGGKVKVQLNWVPEPEFGGLYAARSIGAFSRAGLDVEIVGGGPSSPVIQLVAAGQSDFGVAAAEDVVVARARDVDVVAIFATFQSSPQAIMVHASRGLTSLSDLKSGTLALETGAPFGAWLKKRYGFDGVTIVPADGGVARFLSDPMHAQQCFVTSEPLAAKEKGGDPQIFLARDTGFDPYANVVITRGAMLKEQMPKVKAFVAAVAEGWRAYLADPKSANGEMHAQNGSMDDKTFAAVAEAQKTLIESDDTKAHGLGWMSADRWKTLTSQMADIGTIPNAPDAARCFTDDALPAK